jgi:uncharacterized protein (DUF1697 family)
MATATHFIFIRAIGPVTHKVMPLKDLCKVCEKDGLGKVDSVLATGNLVVNTALPQSKVEAIVAKAIATFKLDNDVFIRSADELQAVIAGNPFPALVKSRPNHLLVQFFDKAPDEKNMAKVRDHGGPEVFVLNGREIYMDYVNGIADSKVQPGWVERKLMQKGTARNWNTLMKLHGFIGS